MNFFDQQRNCLETEIKSDIFSSFICLVTSVEIILSMIFNQYHIFDVYVENILDNKPKNIIYNSSSLLGPQLDLSFNSILILL